MKTNCFSITLSVLSLLLISSMRIDTEPSKNLSNVSLKTSSYCSCKSKPDYYMEVALREIYVTVKDKDGKHIKDLKQEDFKLWEDGIEQKILAADKIDFRKTLLTNGSETSGTQAQIVESLPKRYFTLLIGNLSELDVEKDKSRASILNFIKNVIRKDDYISLYILNSASLDLVVPFNINPQQSRSAVLKYLEGENIGGKGFKGTARGMLESKQIADYMKIDDAQIKNMEFISVSQLLDNLCKGLQYIDGKKDVIIFSEGIFFSPDLSKEMQSMPQNPTPSQFRNIAPAKLGPSSAEMYAGLVNLKKAFIKYDVSLQVIDVGKPSLNLPDIAENRFRRSPGDPKLGSGAQDDEDNVLPESDPGGLEYARTQALWTLSASTGGKFYKYSNSMDEIKRNLDSVDYDTSFYYILSYTSNAENDPDDLLPIKVMVSRDDVKLRYKKAIVIKENFENLNEAEQNAQLNFMAQSSNIYNMLSLCSNIAILPISADKSFIVCGIQMPFEEIAEDNEVNMDIFINIFNKNNESVDSFNKQLKFTLSKEARKAKMKNLALFSAKILSPGEYRVKYFVRNRHNMLISAEEFNISLPDFTGRNVILSSPLIYSGSQDILKLAMDDDGDQNKMTPTKTVFTYLPGVYFLSNEMKSSKKVKIGLMIKGLTTDEIKKNESGLIKWEAVKPVREGFAQETPLNIEYKIEDVIENPDKSILVLFDLDVSDLPKGEVDTVINATMNGIKTSSSIRLNLI